MKLPYLMTGVVSKLLLFPTYDEGLGAA